MQKQQIVTLPVRLRAEPSKLTKRRRSIPGFLLFSLNQFQDYAAPKRCLSLFAFFFTSSWSLTVLFEICRYLSPFAWHCHDTRVYKANGICRASTE